MNPNQLLRKYLADTCTPDELTRVLHYVATPEGEQALKELLAEEAHREHRFSPIDASASERIYRRLQTRLPGRSYRPGWKVAASVALLLLSVSLWYAWLAQPVVYTTHYGETKTVLLPDSSTVVLNGNSTLTLAADWTSDREVWLEGEAFFHVTKRNVPQQGRSLTSSDEYRKFTVHANALNVEVLGTEFNVRQWSEQTSVVLKSGKVRLHRSNYPDTLTMRPGERVTLREQDQTLEKQVVNPETYLAWTEQRLDFEGTTLAEIARIIEETYGYSVIIRDQSLRSKRFQGSIAAEDLTILLDGLSEAFDLRITQQGKQIIID
jgi:ferric-dicitrate binding protein FerR (iron transport regulator)